MAIDLFDNNFQFADAFQSFSASAGGAAGQNDAPPIDRKLHTPLHFLSKFRLFAMKDYRYIYIDNLFFVPRTIDYVGGAEKALAMQTLKRSFNGYQKRTE